MSGPESGPGSSEVLQRCPTCCSGLDAVSRLRRLQVNDDECVIVCSNEKCLSNPSSGSVVHRRKSWEIPHVRRRRQRKRGVDPTHEILAPPTFDPIVLWRNRESLCWLDSSLFVMVFCRSLRRCINASLSIENGSLKTLCREFDNAQVTFQASNPGLISGPTARGHLSAPPRGHCGPRHAASDGGSQPRLSGVTSLDQSFSNDRLSAEECSHSHESELLLGPGVLEVSTFDETSELMQFLDEDTSFVQTDTIERTVTPSEPVETYSTPYRVGGNTSNEDHSEPKAHSEGGQSFQVDEPLALLDAVRERLWGEVQPNLGCERGAEDTPVFALPVILRKNRSLEAHFRTLYHWQFYCSQCGLVEITPCKSVMPSLKTLSRSLNITTYLSHRPCSSCHAPAQRNQLHIRSLPPCPMFHFVEGLPELHSWGQLDFSHGGHEYRVAALIQYTQNPNHFIGWVKDTERNLWLQGDDLKGPIVHWSQEEPAFPASQCHVVMWERQAECTDCSSLQSVVRGILDAERLNLAHPPPPTQGLKMEGWSGIGADEGSSGLCVPPLEAYIPKVARGPSPSTVDDGGENPETCRTDLAENGTLSLATQSVTSSCETDLAENGTLKMATQSVKTSPCALRDANCTIPSDEHISMNSVAESMEGESTEKINNLPSPSGAEQLTLEELTVLSDKTQKLNCDDSSVTLGIPEVSTDSQTGVRCRDLQPLMSEDCPDSEPGDWRPDDSDSGASVRSPSSLLRSIERSSADIATALSSIPAVDGMKETDSSRVGGCSSHQQKEHLHRGAMTRCQSGMDRISQEPFHQVDLGSSVLSSSCPLSQREKDEQSERGSVVSSVTSRRTTRSASRKATVVVPSSPGAVPSVPRPPATMSEREVDEQSECASVSSVASKRTLLRASRKATTVVPSMHSSLEAVLSVRRPRATTADRKDKESDYRDYKRRLNILSRVLEWSVNEVDGPLRRDLEKRARLGRLAAARAAKGRVHPRGESVDSEDLYTGLADPDHILQSIPSQLEAFPTNGRRNSLETWRACRGKPLHMRHKTSGTTSNKSSSSSKKDKPVDSKVGQVSSTTRVTGLAAKFATFKRSLPTFSQYKETVEAAEAARHQRMSRRAGSISPAIGSPSSSSESSGNSRLAAQLSFQQEEFMDVTPITSPTQLLPDLEKFFEGL